MQKPSVIYKDNQGTIFLAKNRQVVIRKKHIDIHRHFLRNMVKKKDMYVNYIWSEYNPADIMTKNTLEAYFARHIKRIAEVEHWELVDTGRGNVKNTGVTDDVITCDKTE